MFNEQFPFLKNRLLPYHYLDNAATSQKPKQVIEAITKFYSQYNANPHSSAEAQNILDRSRQEIAAFINAPRESIVFTKNTTEGLNIAASYYYHLLQSCDEILLTEMEHHSNLLPWQAVAQRTGAKIVFARVKSGGELDIDDCLSRLNEKTKVVAITAVSNVFGHLNNLPLIIARAHKYGAEVVIDAAQAAGHQIIDVNELGCDFLAFSGHKMYGPLGVGVLYIRPEISQRLEPLYRGGGMVGVVKLQNSTWARPPDRFEAGTIDLAGIYAMAEAVKFIQKIGIKAIARHESELINSAVNKLSLIPSIKTYPSIHSGQEGSILSFNLVGVHPHDLSFYLSQSGIIVRGGDHCAQPLMHALNLDGTVRISVALYNTDQDVESLCESVRAAVKLFKRKG